MKRLAIAGLTLTAFSAGTMPLLAADLPQAPAPAYEATPAAQQSIDWTGIYVGGNIGWAFGQFDNNVGATGKTSTDINGLSGGLYTGYNFQLTPNIVLGAELDFTLTDLEKTRTSGGLALRSSSDWNSNVRGRIGYSFDRYLIYGTGGLAIADLEVAGNGDKDSKTALGWTLGAGAEAAITENMVARFDYAYQDFGSQDFNLGGTGVSSDFSNNQVRMGIGYKF
ncbi:MAG: outer membrane protein [Roseibium sp.]